MGEILSLVSFRLILQKIILEKEPGFDVSLKIPVGYNSRPPYYYPVWNMKPGAGDYIPHGTGNQGEDKNFSGLLLGNDVGGKSKCLNAMGEPGDDSCETEDRMIDSQ